LARDDIGPELRRFPDALPHLAHDGHPEREDSSAVLLPAR
jgi:hypothetical protein